MVGGNLTLAVLGIKTLMPHYLTKAPLFPLLNTKLFVVA